MSPGSFGRILDLFGRVVFLCGSCVLFEVIRQFLARTLEPALVVREMGFWDRQTLKVRLTYVADQYGVVNILHDGGEGLDAVWRTCSPAGIPGFVTLPLDQSIGMQETKPLGPR